jgi:hypothetical protein
MGIWREYRERRRTTAERMCIGKKAHSWKDLAEQHRQRLLALPNPREPERLEVYACLWCWCWHVGHIPRMPLK